jgi:hypothetical protein
MEQQRQKFFATLHTSPVFSAFQKDNKSFEELTMMGL